MFSINLPLTSWISRFDSISWILVTLILIVELNGFGYGANKEAWLGTKNESVSVYSCPINNGEVTDFCINGLWIGVTWNWQWFSVIELYVFPLNVMLCCSPGERSIEPL